MTAHTQALSGIDNSVKKTCRHASIYAYFQLGRLRKKTWKWLYSSMTEYRHFHPHFNAVKLQYAFPRIAGSTRRHSVCIWRLYLIKWRE
eukprot:6206916-Pleurochrysis_carterae.AAC.3